MTCYSMLYYNASGRGLHAARGARNVVGLALQPPLRDAMQGAIPQTRATHSICLHIVNSNRNNSSNGNPHP